MGKQRTQWAQLTRQRWLILIVNCLINMCIGAIYTWSVFSPALADHLNKLNGSTLNAGSLSLAFTVCNLVGPITMISGGFINDRVGPRGVVFLGGLMFGGGLLICSIATSVSMVMLGFGLVCGLAMGLVYSCTVNNSVKFFPDHRGFIGGLVTATYGISSVLIPPIATRLIENDGVDSTLRFFGLIFLTIICGGSFCVRRCPPGFVPDGWDPSVQNKEAPKMADQEWNEMLCNPIFYVMLFMLTCGAFSGLMVISQASSIAQFMVGMTPGTAAVIVSALALFNGSGRVLSGWVSDRLGCIRTLQAIFLFSILGLALLLVAHSGTTGVFLTGIAFIGFCFGSFMGIFPGFTAEQFGSRNNSVNYGIMFIGFALAGFFGPMSMSFLCQHNGNYLTSFRLGIVLCVIGFMLTFVYLFFKHQNVTPSQSFTFGKKSKQKTTKAIT
ncbi:MAG: OFA family MFS transporter [Lawsonibacter sp.]|nr:OFA family MFS transporter [Lawsonibacter sp.]